MTQTAERITAEELLHISDPPGLRSELVDGFIRYRPLADAWSGMVCSGLAYRVFEYVNRERTGQCFAGGTGFIVHRNPDTVRAPSSAFVSGERLGRFVYDREGYLPCAPDLAIEFYSSFDHRQYFEEKIGDWFAGDARMVWVVNPRRKTVMVYRSPTEVRLLTANDNLDGEDVLPGFTCLLKDIFTLD